MDYKNNLVLKAINFAAEKHRGQERKASALPYIIHPFTGMYLISQYKTSKNMEILQAAMLLHDTLEDTDCNYIELEREFGPMVASIVMELTSDLEKIKEIGKKQYIINKMLEMSKYAFFCKLIDRFSNVLDNPTIKYCKDTIETMKILLEKRIDLTNSQRKLIIDIIDVCQDIINEKREDNE